jgi:hypothetical protein
MKKFCLPIAISVFWMIFSDKMQAQTLAYNLNQLKLMEQLLGPWQKYEGKDTVLISEIQQYGNAFVETYHRIINGKKTWLSIWSYSFSPKEGKFKIFGLMSNGSYSTWIASFTSEKRWIQEQVQNFNTDKVLRKIELVLDTQTNLTVSRYNSDGIKTGEEKWIKVK